MLTARNFRRYSFTCLCLCLLVFVTGCWDRREIERRAIVLGIGFDPVPASNQQEPYDLSYTPTSGMRKYRVTFEMPSLSKAKKESSESSGEGGKNMVVSSEGESMFAILRAANTQMPFTIRTDALQLLVFSETLAREGIDEVVDQWIRNESTRRRAKVFVTPGRAEDIFKAKLLTPEPNSMLITKIMASGKKTPIFPVKQTEIADIYTKLRDKRSFIVPIVAIEGKNVKISKAAIFKKNKMIGELSETEVRGARILDKTLEQGVTVVPFPDHPKKVVVFELFRSKINIKSHVQEDQLRFSVDAKFWGNVGETSKIDQDMFDAAFLKAVEQAVAEELTQKVRIAYTKQQHLQAEVCELGELVRRQHPQYWKKIKKHWENELFPTVPLEINIQVIIEKVGMIH